MAALILCYHALSPSWEVALAVRPEDFSRQMARLSRRGYRGVTVSEACSAPKGERVVGISFDDGFESVLTYAAPVLAERGFKATMYAPTGFVGADRLEYAGLDATAANQDDVRPLDWAGLRELIAAGWEVGSHTVSHASLPQLAEADIARELEASKETLEEKLGRPCSGIAYPYGRYDDRVLEVTRRVGYEVGVATLPGRLKTSRTGFDVPRMVVNRRDDERRFALKTSKPMLQVKASPAWRLIPHGHRSKGRRARS